MADYHKMLMLVNIATIVIDLVVLWWLIFKPSDCTDLRYKMMVFMSILSLVGLGNLLLTCHVAGVT